MPTDWLFYWMTLPLGLAAIALVVALPFALWRIVLANKFKGIGFKPLATGYAFSAIGSLVANFGSSYLEFSARVSKDVLPEAQRWSIVPGWTIYITVLSLILVLPLVGLVGVPVSALLLKLRRLSYKSIVVLVIVTWLALALAAWTFLSNEWDRTHRLDSLTMWLTELAPNVAFIALPFLLGVYYASRSYRNAET